MNKTIYRVRGYNRDGDGETVSTHTSKASAVSEARSLVRSDKGSRLKSAVMSATVWTVDSNGRDVSLVAEVPSGRILLRQASSERR